jgi:hypothetical protein
MNAANMPVDVDHASPVSPSNRSRITNGASILPGVDGRSTWARRLRDLICLYTADLGGPEAVSSAEASIIRRASCLTLECERLEVAFATAEARPEDLDLYQRMSNTLRRHLETNGLKRVAKDVTSVASYIEASAE